MSSLFKKVNKKKLSEQAFSRPISNGMNNFEKTIRDTAHTTHLSPDAKARMRERVMEYTTYKPIRTPFAVDYSFAYAYVYRAVSVALIAVLVVGGTGTAYASQDALPGDALYGVKEITEAVLSKVSVTDESRIAWNIERAQRRLDEARALAARNALTKERDEYLAQQFNALIETVETDIQTIQKQNEPLAQALSLDLEFGVQAYTKALERTARVRVDKDPATLVAARVRGAPVLPVAAAPAVATATMATFAQNDTQERDDTYDQEKTMMAIEQVSGEHGINNERTKETDEDEAIAALRRTVERQEARLKKEAAKAQARAQEEAQATIRAIAEVRKHIEEDQQTKEPEQERIETRALLEATLGEVHDARVRIKVEIEDGDNSGSGHDEYDAHDDDGEEAEQELRAR